MTVRRFVDPRQLSPRLIGTVAGTAAIAILAWPIPQVPPSPGTDASFIAGLHMASAAGLDVGTEIVSTYGPLGFLSFPEPVYGPTSALAVLHAATIVLPLVAILVHRAAAVLPFWAALVVAYVGAQAIRWLGIPEMALALVGISALLALEHAAQGRRIPDWAVAGAGVFVAIIGLGKLNTGAVVVAIAAVTVGAIGGRRQLLVLSGAVLATVVLAWIATGQVLSNVLPFISTSASIVLGFNAAMGVDGHVSVHWMVSAAFVALATLAYATYGPMRSWPSGLRVAAVVVAALLAFMTLKAGFVRWHYQFVFATLLIVAIALMTPGVSRRVGLLATAAMLLALVGVLRLGLVEYLDPSPRAALSQAATLLSTADEAAATREVLASAYAIEEPMLRRMRGATVHIGALESAVAFAHPDLVWAPLPVFQDYMAYTTSLDDLNRQRLLGADAPEFILRRVPAAIDGRNPWFEAPSTTRTMLCRYQEVAVADPWQLLQRDVDRCGDPVLLSSTHTEPGAPVDVPPLPDGDAMLFVRVNGLDPGLGEAVSSFLLKADEWYITRDGTEPFRLVTPTASQGLVLAVGDALAHSGPFAFGEPWQTVTVEPGPRSSVSDIELELEFWAVPAVAASAGT